MAAKVNRAESVRQETARKGGQRGGRVYPFTLTANVDQLVVSAGSRRQTLVLVSGSADVWYNFGAPAAVGTGLRMPANVFPLKIDRHWLGDLLRLDLHAFSAAGLSLSVVEVTGDDD